MDKIIEISNWIENNRLQIIENIEQESIDVYNFLRNQFQNSNTTKNYLFQFVYRSFYRIDNAGLTPEFKTAYFELLEYYRDKEVFNFEDILSKLYSFPNRKGQNTIQFSFVTKMANTINEISPIYDSEVAKMFSLARPYQIDFYMKLDKYLDQLSEIQLGYELILEKKLLSNTISCFNDRFENNNIPEMKKLDFVFWSAGKVSSSENLKGDDGFHTIEELDEIDNQRIIENFNEVLKLRDLNKSRNQICEHLKITDEELAELDYEYNRITGI